MQEMEDEYQENETVTLQNGQMSNPAQGLPIKVTIWPALVKNGNEEGEKYDESVVVSKAKVLLPSA